jgi:L-rhamnose isomerase / sugar isomerase
VKYFTAPCFDDAKTNSMRIEKDQIQEINKKELHNHQAAFDFLSESLTKQGIDVSEITSKLFAFQVAIPSWALGAGGTRFGRFSFYGEPSTLEQKIEDIGLIHSLTQTAGAISLHIPWDVPKDFEATKALAASYNLVFDAVNSNTFQDQKNAKESYKYGSLSHNNLAVREQAIQHNKDVIKIGEQLGSKSITVWLADGAAFPGQNNFQIALQNTQDSLKEIYKTLPNDWKMFIEYKPYEPNFYSTVIQDWGTSYTLASECGEKAYSLVDLGHHLPNTNIEQIVATLMMKGKLGGFHFNDSKYGDDDLTVGSIKPYALFLIFNELVYGMNHNPQNPDLAWMIDASHNIKDPLEDLMQSLDAILVAYAKALLIDQKALKNSQQAQDVVMCQEILHQAYHTDVRPLIERARLNQGGALRPIEVYRNLNIRKELVNQRGKNSVATGL